MKTRNKRPGPKYVWVIAKLDCRGYCPYLVEWGTWVRHSQEKGVHHSFSASGQCGQAEAPGLTLFQLRVLPNPTAPRFPPATGNSAANFWVSSQSGAPENYSLRATFGWWQRRFSCSWWLQRAGLGSQLASSLPRQPGHTLDGGSWVWSWGGATKRPKFKCAMLHCPKAESLCLLTTSCYPEYQGLETRGSHTGHRIHPMKICLGS